MATKTGSIHYWVANWNLSRAQAVILLGHDATEMVDCIAGDLDNVLKSYPHVKRFAGYVTGSDDIKWTAAEFAKVPKEAAVLRIDQSNSDAPLRADAKVAKDVESGASTIATAVTVAGDRIRDGLDATIYIEQSELTELEDAIERAGLPRGTIIGYQYASPMHTPNTMLPGSGLTIKEANCDLSVVRPEWLPLPVPVAPSAPATVKAERISRDTTIPLDGKNRVVRLELERNTAGKWDVLSVELEAAK